MTEKKLLNRIGGPADLVPLRLEELEALAAEIRRELLEVVAENGGHLASNLGVVELSIALERVFHEPGNPILWDVGHQSYVHKLLTGRQQEFRSLRRYGGCSGFPQPLETSADPFVAGHAGNAISAALGFSAVYRRTGRSEKAVAVVGDGALNCGISLEGLNNIAGDGRNLVIVLNDNKMSIAQNVGAISSHLNRLIAGRRYNRFKNAFKNWLSNDKLTRKIGRVLDAFKHLILPGSLFEELGLRYLGPINGHNLKDLLYTFEAVREFDYPVLVHVVTEKGHGFPPAVNRPDKFHGIGPFDPATGEPLCSRQRTFAAAFGDAVTGLARRDGRVAAITAGMKDGTGLAAFAREFPRRFFDVGIAEEHAVVFSGGLAKAGMRPVVAIYSTFLLRALDCVFHDVCLAGLPVIFAIDRAGAVEDGPTHHGIYDLAFLRTLSNLVILSPADVEELPAMFDLALELSCPVAIRYPRGGVTRTAGVPLTPVEKGRAEVRSEGGDCALWALGPEVATAEETARILAESGIAVTVVNARFVQPLDLELLRRHAETMPVFTLEDHRSTGGFGSAVQEALDRKVYSFGWGGEWLGHGDIPSLRRERGLTPEKIAESIRSQLDS